MKNEVDTHGGEKPNVCIPPR